MTDSPQYLHPMDGYGHLGLNERTAHRWKAAAPPEDLPPFDVPDQLEAWYDRMRLSGRFKNRMRIETRDAIRRHVVGSGELCEDPDVTSFGMARFLTSESRSLGDEIEKLQQLVRAARRNAEASIRQDRDEEGRRHLAQAIEWLGDLTTLQLRQQKIEETEGKTVKVTDVERDLGELVPRVIENLLAAGRKLVVDLKSPLPPAEGSEIVRGTLKRCFEGMRASKFAPPLDLVA